MKVIDASSVIYAWDNYPIEQFPGLWDWVETQIQQKELMIPDVAYDEVKINSSDCAIWLKNKNVDILNTNSSILQEVLRIQKLLGIVDDNYHPKGVDENDLIIISMARAHHVELISDEARQPGMPKEPSKRKIPAVCSMNKVGVPCINFLEYIKRSKFIFR